MSNVVSIQYICSFVLSLFINLYIFNVKLTANVMENEVQGLGGVVVQQICVSLNVNLKWTCCRALCDWKASRYFRSQCTAPFEPGKMKAPGSVHRKRKDPDVLRKTGEWEVTFIYWSQSDTRREVALLIWERDQVSQDGISVWPSLTSCVPVIFVPSCRLSLSGRNNRAYLARYP